MNTNTAYRNPAVHKGGDPDEDWMVDAVLTAASTFSRRQPRVRFVPAFPVEFLQAASAAGDALPLLLLAFAEMRVRQVGEIAVGPALWAAAGNPSKRVRSRLLRQLSCLPGELCELIVRKGRPHLLRAGPRWPKPLQPRMPHDAQTGGAWSQKRDENVVGERLGL
jgi:hypothetical protein